MKINFLKTTINNVLRDIPQSRDDDACLIFNVWKQMQDDGEPEIPEYIYALLRKFYPDSITRIRRMFQKEGLYPATEAKQKQRRHEQIVVAYEMAAPNFIYPVWKEKDGREIPVQKMNINHILSAYKYLETLGWSTESERIKINSWKGIFKLHLDQANIKLDSTEVKAMTGS